MCTHGETELSLPLIRNLSPLRATTPETHFCYREEQQPRGRKSRRRERDTANTAAPWFW